jgi:hypothetical protein
MVDPKEVAKSLGLDPNDPEVISDLEKLKPGATEPVSPPPPSSPILEPKGRTNRLAVVALICSCFLSFGPISGVLGMVFGSAAKREVRESQGSEWGIGMAEAAQMLGLLNILLSVIGIGLLIAALTK